MDEATVRPVVEAHAQAVVDPIDIASVQADLIDDLHAGLPQLASALPQPVREATVDSLEISGDQSIAHITYTGDESSLTIRSVWEDTGKEQPQVVQATPQ